MSVVDGKVYVTSIIKSLEKGIIGEILKESLKKKLLFILESVKMIVEVKIENINGLCMNLKLNDASGFSFDVLEKYIKGYEKDQKKSFDNLLNYVFKFLVDGIVSDMMKPSGLTGYERQIVMQDLTNNKMKLIEEF